MNPTIQRVTYIDATPTREHLHQLDQAGVTGYALARATGINQTIISRVMRGITKHIRSDNAAILCATNATDIRRATKPPAYVDHEVLLRILAGNREQTITSTDKPAYARALKARGWTQNRIATVLHMSGRSVKNALQWQDAV